MYFYIIIFIFLIIFSLSDINKNRRIELVLLTFSLCCLAILVGLRGKTGTDSTNYINFFTQSTSDIIDYDSNKKQYAEEGFYFISAVVKSFTKNYTIYFLIISSITFAFYYRSITYFAIFPLLSLAYYVARFMPFREMNQIRGALAIAIIVYSLRFLINNHKGRYIAACIAASLFHYSSLIAIPLVLIVNRQFPIKKIIFLLVISIIGGFLIQLFLKNILLSSGNIVMLTYVGETDLGYHNPILYFQIIICILYSYYGTRLKIAQKGYNIIKNAYLYSVLILCLTAGLGSIGGRLSTIFATCEIFIIPNFILVFRQKYIGFACIMCLTSLVFLLNYNRMLAEAAKWSYKWTLL